MVAKVVLELSDSLTAGGAISAPLLIPEQFSALVLMAFVTTLIAPITLRWAALRTCHPDEKAGFCELWDRGAGR